VSAASYNIHATAVTIDGIGLVFLGASGSGKSALAFDCLAEAGLADLTAKLLSDDRVIVSRENETVVGRAPQQIRGLIELRYSGIVAVDHVVEAPLHYAVMGVGSDENNRLPPDDERVTLVEGIELPLIRVPGWSRFPLSLIRARIRSLEANR
jgi:serine kinase of HPr protein (carbohydrate metabolism regulator)